MKKQTILEQAEIQEIIGFLKILLIRVEKEDKPDCNIALLMIYIENLEANT